MAVGNTPHPPCRAPSPRKRGEGSTRGILDTPSPRARGEGRGEGRIALLLACILSACTAGPDYVKPTVDIPSAFIYEPKDAADTANTQWWKQFNDPVLDALIAEALANNQNVKVAAANVEQAAGVLTQTRSG